MKSSIDCSDEIAQRNEFSEHSIQTVSNSKFGMIRNFVLSVVVTAMYAVASAQTFSQCKPAGSVANFGSVGVAALVKAGAKRVGQHDYYTVGSTRSMRAIYVCSVPPSGLVGIRFNNLSSAGDGLIFWGNSNSVGRLLVRMYNISINGVVTRVLNPEGGGALSSLNLSESTQQVALELTPDFIPNTGSVTVAFDLDVTGYVPKEISINQQVQLFHRISASLY